MKSKNKRERGQVSRLLLVLAIIILVAVVITYLVMQMANPAPKPVEKEKPTVPLPVYEKQLGNIRFIFQSGTNRGSILKASAITNPQYNYAYQKDINTTEKFIQVTVGAQNLGTKNTEQNAWDIENIVDSEGHEYVPYDNYAVAPWLPMENGCKELLKPAFQATPCTKIYEVAKESTGLKIRVLTGKDNTATNFSSGKTDSALLDLIVK